MDQLLLQGGLKQTSDMSTLNDAKIGDVILLVPEGQEWLVLERFQVIGRRKEIFRLVSAMGVFKVVSCVLDENDLDTEIWFVSGGSG